MTLSELLRRTQEWFTQLGIESARLDAEVLIAHALQIDRITLYTDGQRPLGDEEVARCRELVARRGKREPVAYIVGTREFWSLDFAVDQRVLIPRPDTETLVQLALEWLDGAREAGSGIEPVVHYDEHVETAAGEVPETALPEEPFSAPPALEEPGLVDARLLLDYGTGSGAIGVTIATERPGLRVLALDVSRDALSVAKGNAARHGVSDRVGFVCSDGFQQLPARFRGQIAAIVANPPHVPLGDEDSLAADVREHEPRHALFAGPDPLLHYRRIAEAATKWLRPDGFVAVEVGFGQAAAVAELFSRLGRVEIRRDLGGIERVVAARR